MEMSERQEAFILLPEDAADLLGLLQVRLLKNHNVGSHSRTDHSFQLALASCIVPTAVAQQVVSAKLAWDMMTTASR